MSGALPVLSVVIAAGRTSEDLPRMLAGIARQAAGLPVEILVVHAEGNAPAGIAPAGPRGVRLLPVAEGTTLPRLLGAALAVAEGEVIAITDSTCGIDERWIASILGAHEAPHAVVGGAVEPEGLRTLVDWAAYFCDYGQFMLPLEEGPAREVPGNNLSLKREALSEGRQFAGREFWKTYWCREVQAAGHAVVSTPSIVVSYRKRFGLVRYLHHRFHNGRCFAGMRLAQLGGARRVAYALGSPVLTVLLSWRIVRAVAAKGRHRTRLLLALPIIVVASFAWALGELLGYLGGPGGSCRHVR